tara:strand:- start:3162 stop:5489 length:2328 start_codon:yes stop_codon:yes gene_type:complete
MSPKNIFYFIFFYFLAQSSFAQNTQTGLVREFNSDKEPLPNVGVEFFGAGATSSGVDGKFVLNFIKEKEPGALVTLQRVIKSGYEIVNETDLQGLRFTNDGKLAKDIVLAKNGVIDAAKAEYSGASMEALTNGYKRERNALMAKLEDAKLTEEDYQGQIVSLSNNFEIQKARLEDLAATFSRVNFDDASPIYQEALVLYKEGKLKEAIEKLETVDLPKLFYDYQTEDKRIANVDAIQEEDKRIQNEKKNQIIEMVSSKANLYALNLDPIRAEESIDSLLLFDSTNLVILKKSADFFREQHRYEKAEKLYQKIIAHEDVKEWQKANSFGFLGDLAETTGNLEVALSYYQKLLDIYQSLFKLDKSSFNKGNLAISYSRLGKIYSMMGDLEVSLSFYQYYLDTSKELNEAFPENVIFKNSLAISYSKLGETYSALKNFDAALEFYLCKMTLFKELYYDYPNNPFFKNGLSISYSKLGDTHSSLNNFGAALEFYLNDLKLVEQLIEVYSSNVSYRYGLAISYEKLGDTYEKLGDFKLSKNFYLDEVTHFDELNKAYPTNVSFKYGLAISFYKLASMLEAVDLNTSINYLSLSLQHYQELVNISPQNTAYVNMFLFIANHLSLLEYQKTLKESERIHFLILKESDSKKYLDLYERYVNALEEEQSSKEVLVQAINSNAWYALLSGKFNKAELLIRKGISLDITYKYLYTNLPPSLLLQGKTEDAIAEYLKWADRTFGEQDLATYKDAFLADFLEFETAGIIPEERKADVEKVRELLNQEK